jgi:hypothetical protein
MYWQLRLPLYCEGKCKGGGKGGGGAVGYRGFPTFHCWQHFGFCDKPLVAGMVMIVMCHVLEL